MINFNYRIDQLFIMSYIPYINICMYITCNGIMSTKKPFDGYTSQLRRIKRNQYAGMTLLLFNQLRIRRHILNYYSLKRVFCSLDF